MRDIGVEKLATMSKQELKIFEKATDTSMFKVFLILVGGFILLMLLDSKNIFEYKKPN